jgi:hypothetical protein
VGGYGAPMPLPVAQPAMSGAATGAPLAAGLYSPGGAAPPAAPSYGGLQAAGYAASPAAPAAYGQLAAAGYAPALQAPHHASLPPGAFGLRPDALKVPMLLLDTTGSMAFAAAQRSPAPRHELVRQSLAAFVRHLEMRQGAGGCGLRTVTFGGGGAGDLGYLASPDLAQQWQRISWEGGTYLAPGWQLVQRIFAQEAAASGALLTALLLTDGEAADMPAFEAMLARRETRARSAQAGAGASTLALRGVAR